MLRVTEYFASRSTSVKVIEDGTLGKLGYGCLFAFHDNNGRVFSRFDKIHERDGHRAIA